MTCVHRLLINENNNFKVYSSPKSFNFIIITKVDDNMDPLYNNEIIEEVIFQLTIIASFLALNDNCMPFTLYSICYVKVIKLFASESPLSKNTKIINESF